MSQRRPLVPSDETETTPLVSNTSQARMKNQASMASEESGDADTATCFATGCLSCLCPHPEDTISVNVPSSKFDRKPRRSLLYGTPSYESMDTRDDEEECNLLNEHEDVAAVSFMEKISDVATMSTNSSTGDDEGGSAANEREDEDTSVDSSSERSLAGLSLDEVSGVFMENVSSSLSNSSPTLVSRSGEESKSETRPRPDETNLHPGTAENTARASESDGPPQSSAEPVEPVEQSDAITSPRIDSLSSFENLHKTCEERSSMSKELLGQLIERLLQPGETSADEAPGGNVPSEAEIVTKNSAEQSGAITPPDCNSLSTVENLNKAWKRKSSTSKELLGQLIERIMMDPAEQSDEIATHRIDSHSSFDNLLKTWEERSSISKELLGRLIEQLPQPGEPHTDRAPGKNVAQASEDDMHEIIAKNSDEQSGATTTSESNSLGTVENLNKTWERKSSISKGLLGQLIERITMDSVEQPDEQSDVISLSSLGNIHKTWEERSSMGKELLGRLIEELPQPGEPDTDQTPGKNVTQAAESDMHEIITKNSDEQSGATPTPESNSLGTIENPNKTWERKSSISEELLGQPIGPIAMDSVEQPDEQSDAIALSSLEIYTGTLSRINSFSSLENLYNTWEERSSVSKELLGRLIERLPQPTDANTDQAANGDLAQGLESDRHEITRKNSDEQSGTTTPHGNNSLGTVENLNKTWERKSSISKELLGQLIERITMDSAEQPDEQSDAISLSSLENLHKTWEERSSMSKELLGRLIDRLPRPTETSTDQDPSGNVVPASESDRHLIVTKNSHEQSGAITPSEVNSLSTVENLNKTRERKSSVGKELLGQLIDRITMNSVEKTDAIAPPQIDHKSAVKNLNKALEEDSSISLEVLGQQIGHFSKDSVTVQGSSEKSDDIAPPQVDYPVTFELDKTWEEKSSKSKELVDKIIERVTKDSFASTDFVERSGAITSPQVNSPSTFEDLNKTWEEKSATSKELLGQLIERLGRVERHYSASAQEKEELARKLIGMKVVKDALENEIAESRRRQATSPLKIDEPSLGTSASLSKTWEDKSATGKDLLVEVINRLGDTEERLLVTKKQKEVMAEKLAQMQSVNKALKNEMRNHARLLNHVNKLLERLDKKDNASSIVTIKMNGSLALEETAEDIRKLKLANAFSGEQVIPSPSSLMTAPSGTDEINVFALPNLTIKTTPPEAQPQKDAKLHQVALEDTAQASSNSDPLKSNADVTTQGSVPIASSQIDESSFQQFMNLSKSWKENGTIGREVLAKLAQRLDENERRLSATTKQKEEMEEKLAEMQVLNDTLRTDFAKSKRNQSRLLSHVNKLLDRIDEKEDALSNAAMGAGEVVEKLATAKGPLNKELDELPGQVDGAVGRSPNLIVEANVQAVKGANATEPWDTSKSGIQKACVDLPLAVSPNTAASPPVETLHGAIEKLRRENESLREELYKSRARAPEEQQARAASLRSYSSIYFYDVTNSTSSLSIIPNGYHGLDWENFGVMHRSFSPGNGYEYGIALGDYVAFNPGGRPCSVSSATPFSVAGFQATAAYDEGLEVVVEGFDDRGNIVGRYQTALADPRDGPTFVDLRQEGNFEGVHKLTISSFGGTPLLKPYSSTHLAIDGMLIY